MCTLSKGLGAPAGSILLGTRAFIDQARVWRKRLGGGMRQVGILAAAGLIALEEGPERLAEDHANARRLGEGIANIPGTAIDLDRVVTNIVIFDISETGKTSAEITQTLASQGILAIGFGSQIRMVTHIDVSAEDIDTTIQGLKQCLHT
jgi:threonine aldolase